MNHLNKNKEMKKILIKTILILAIATVIFNFMSISEATITKNVDNKDSASKNLNIESIAITNETYGGLKGAVEKSKNGNTIYLKKGVYKFNNTKIKINKTLTIVGRGPTKDIVIDGRSKGRIFNIAKNGKLKLINVTLKNGFGLGKGGAINNKGSLSTNRCAFTKNDAGTDGVNIFGDGGAIYNTGSLNLKNSIFKESKADFGVSIYCSSKHPIYISKCRFVNNKVGYGSAILNDYTGNSPKIVIKNSYFKNFGIDNSNDNTKITGNKFVIHSNSKNEKSAINNFGLNVTISYNTIKGVGKPKNLQFAIQSSGSFDTNIRANYNNIYCNKIYGPFELGITIDGIKSKIYKNQLYGNNKGHIGINIHYSKYNIVTKNTVSRFKNGIYVPEGLKTNKISHNKLIENTVGLSSSYTFKNKSNIFKGNKINIKKIKINNYM